VTGDYIRRKCGGAPMTPKTWGPSFAPRTQPSMHRADYPSMEELRATFERVYVDLVSLAPNLPDGLLNSVNPLEYTRERFPTTGQFIAYIMTGHLGYHLGQLSGWRAAAGLPVRPGATSEV
jgi:DinB family protein